MTAPSPTPHGRTALDRCPERVPDIGTRQLVINAVTAAPADLLELDAGERACARAAQLREAVRIEEDI